MLGKLSRSIALLSWIMVGMTAVSSPLSAQTIPIHPETQALLDKGKQARAAHSFEEAQRQFTEALNKARSLSDKSGEAEALRLAGLIYHDAGQQDKAIELTLRSLIASREAMDGWREAAALNNLGIDFCDSGQMQRAISYYTQALRLFQSLKNRGGEAVGGGGQASLWRSGVESPLGSTGPGLDYATSVNSQGQVTGMNDTHAFLWTPDTANGTTSTAGIKILDPPGTYISYAMSLNDASQVVGYAEPLQYTSPGNSGPVICFLWDTVNGWRDLKTITDLPGNWIMGTKCYAISNRTVNGLPAAQIITTGSITFTTTIIVHHKPVTTTTYENHGFLLTPE